MDLRDLLLAAGLFIMVTAWGVAFGRTALAMGFPPRGSVGAKWNDPAPLNEFTKVTWKQMSDRLGQCLLAMFAFGICLAWAAAFVPAHRLLWQ